MSKARPLTRIRVPVMVLYLAATCVSCFFSSHGFVRLFSVLARLSFVAALLSHLIYLQLRFRSLGGFRIEPPFVPVRIPDPPQPGERAGGGTLSRPAAFYSVYHPMRVAPTKHGPPRDRWHF